MTTSEELDSRPLIAVQAGEEDSALRDDDWENQEASLTRPTIFLWLLTFTAGVSGLLFGYECVRKY